MRITPVRKEAPQAENVSAEAVQRVITVTRKRPPPIRSLFDAEDMMIFPAYSRTPSRLVGRPKPATGLFTAVASRFYACPG